MNFAHHDFLYDLLLITSVTSIVGVSAMAYGYRASLYSENHTTKWFARSITLLAMGYVFRRITWDLAVPLFVGSIYYEPADIVFNVINLAAVYFGLQARLELIPEHERHRWHWYSAWMHPGLFRVRPTYSE